MTSTRVPRFSAAARSGRCVILAGLVLGVAVGCGGAPKNSSDGTSGRGSAEVSVAERGVSSSHRASRHGGDAVPQSPPAAEGGELSPFDLDHPQVAHLDPELRDAVQRASDDAAEAGVELWVTSGWRSREHQQRLLDEAVATYGSLDEALRFVSTPDASAHVTGDAVDIGPTEAAGWLGRHGAAYGLCQPFANESWHFELSTTPGGDCPEPLPDSSHR